MARHKDAEWNLAEPVARWEEVTTAVLMDIRDELKKLNRLLHCENFTSIPAMLRQIDVNTAKPRTKKAKP